MPSLRNIREEAGRVHADFTVADGRHGSVSVDVAAYRAHGEAALQQEADAAERWAETHGYRAPELDRHRELD